MSSGEQAGPAEEYQERFPPGRCTILECTAGHEQGDDRTIIVSLGHENGAVDRVMMSGAEGRRWVGRLAALLRDSGPPLKVRYGSREWFSRHSVLRAEASVAHDVDAATEGVRRSLPDVWEFADVELKKVERLLKRTGRTAVRPDTLVDRLRRVMLVVIEATRADT